LLKKAIRHAEPVRHPLANGPERSEGANGLRMTSREVFFSSLLMFLRSAISAARLDKPPPRGKDELVGDGP